MRLILIVLTLSSLLFSANIVSEAGGATRTILETHDYSRNVIGYAGNDSFTVVMHCRFYRYTAPRENMPLVVNFVEWGGSLNGAEGKSQYENVMNDPFMSLAIMPERDGTDYNMGQWYWGNVYTDSHGDTWSVPWAHNAVIGILNDIKYGNLNSELMGYTVDTNRIYAHGSSIGGTASAQIAIKHPEIFAAFHSHVGWTRYTGLTNGFFSGSSGCRGFSNLVGGITVGNEPNAHCEMDENVFIHGNADQTHLPLGNELYVAGLYTDLNWYFNKTGDTWNYRDPSFPTPFVLHTTGSLDDPEDQGDNLIPAMDVSRRGFMYSRVNDGHSGGGGFLRWNRLRNFRKNQSFLAFTNRSYDDFTIVSGLGTGTGFINNLEVHGWDPATIIDEANHYAVSLTGTGIADVTLRNLQHLTHSPGTVYTVTLNGAPAGQITADEFGLVTIPAVPDAAIIDLAVQGSFAEVLGTNAGVELLASPNPFNPEVVISARTHGMAPLKIAIYDITGRFVEDLSAKMKDQQVAWNAAGQPSGMYVVRMITGNTMVCKRMTLMK